MHSNVLAQNSPVRVSGGAYKYVSSNTPSTRLRRGGPGSEGSETAGPRPRSRGGPVAPAGGLRRTPPGPRGGAAAERRRAAGGSRPRERRSPVAAAGARRRPTRWPTPLPETPPGTDTSIRGRARRGRGGPSPPVRRSEDSAPSVDGAQAAEPFAYTYQRGATRIGTSRHPMRWMRRTPRSGGPTPIAVAATSTRRPR